MIWILFGIMLLAAALVVSWPLWRAEKRLTPALAVVVIVVLGVTALVYSSIGTPVLPPGLATVDEMVAALDRRLQEHPDDLEGWQMLGRSYMQLQNYPKAIAAFERAARLESPPSAGTLASLGEALLIGEGSTAGRASQLFESALAAEPANPKALFYGGIAAIERGDRALAATRWEALLALAPPPEIEGILRQRVAEWRGETEAVAEAAPPSATQGVGIHVSLGPLAATSVTADATVFIIARDPGQPSPPVAAARRKVSELPAFVALSDADSMIPGRRLSAFDRLEVVARVSMSGAPAAQPGDWFGQQTISNPAAAPVNIVIDTQVK